MREMAAPAFGAACFLRYAYLPWEETCKSGGAAMACDYVICNQMPDEEEVTACKNLGAMLV